MLLLILYTSVALGFSFLCSLLEAVLLSLSPTYIAKLEEQGHKAAASLHELKANIHRPLAAILSLNTIAHTIGAAGAGAQAQALWGSNVLAIVSAILTILILVLSEIIPKTLGALYCQRLAAWTARVLVIMIWILKPLVLLSEKLTRLLAVERAHDATVSRDDLVALARLGALQGTMKASESLILKNLLSSGNQRVRDIMTPRTVIAALDETVTVQETMEQERSAMRFSRIPVWLEHEDAITGYVLKNEVLLLMAQAQGDRTLGDIRRPIVTVPESLPIAQLLERMLDKHEQIAIVVDEYGGLAGVVTVEDVVETLLGREIVDEADPVRDTRALARTRWSARARSLGLPSTSSKSNQPSEELPGTKSEP